MYLAFMLQNAVTRPTPVHVEKVDIENVNILFEGREGGA
jgi:hypothetical protein